jgi:hypothetical protein
MYCPQGTKLIKSTTYKRFIVREVHCPYCRSKHIQPSHSIIGWLLSVLGRTTYRCQLCGMRFTIASVRPVES